MNGEACTFGCSCDVCLLAYYKSEVKKLLNILRLDKNLEDFDCLHTAEDQCTCGITYRKMLDDYRFKRDVVLGERE
jgi:hypothetical protein